MSQVTIFALQRSKTEVETFEWRFNRGGTHEIGVDGNELAAAQRLWLVRWKCLDPIDPWQHQTLHLHYRRRCSSWPTRQRAESQKCGELEMDLDLRRLKTAWMAG